MMQTTLRRCSTYILDQFSSYGDGGVALPAEGKQLVVQEKCWFRFYRPTPKENEDIKDCNKEDDNKEEE